MTEVTIVLSLLELSQMVAATSDEFRKEVVEVCHTVLLLKFRKTVFWTALYCNLTFHFSLKAGELLVQLGLASFSSSRL